MSDYNFMNIKMIVILFLFAFSLSESLPASAHSSSDNIEDYVIDPNTYIVGPGDVFDFRMNTSNKIINTNLTVSPVGDVIVPIVGQIDVSNMVLSDVFELIRRECKNKIENSTVDVTLLKIKTFKVLVLGARGIPTGYYYVNSAMNLLNLFNDVNSRFDNNSKAYEGQSISSRNIILKSQDGIEKKYDLMQYRYNGNIEENPFLLPGDFIRLNYVQDQVFINGAVMVPGTYEYKPNESLLNLINLAGGYTNNADLNNIEIARYVSSTDKEIIYLKESMFKDFILKPSDQILIKPKKDYKRKINVTINGEVANPGVYSINGACTIRDIISRAGGYSLHADSSKIKLNNRFIEKLADRELERISLINYEDRSDEDRAYVKARSHVRKGEFISSDFAMSSFIADYKLFNNDVIYVPSKYDFVEIIGAVKNPGRYPFEKDFTFNDYVEQAGGFTKRATKKYFIIESNTGEKIPVNKPKTQLVSSQDVVFIQAKTDYNTWERFQDGIALASRILTIMAIINNL